MEEIDQINEILAIIDDLRTRGVLIIVEGFKDKAALARLELENVFALERTPLYKAVEHAAAFGNEVVLLVDLDHEGKKLYHLLAQDLQKHKVRIDNTLRDLLFKTPLRHIEGLDSFLDRALAGVHARRKIQNEKKLKIKTVKNK